MKSTFLLNPRNCISELNFSIETQETATLNLLSLDDFQETMTLKIASLSIIGNRAAEISGAGDVPETVALKEHSFKFPALAAFFNLSVFATSVSAGCRIIWARVRAWQLGFATSNPPLNRSAQQRDLPTGKGSQRARLAPRWALPGYHFESTVFVDSKKTYSQKQRLY